jgi:hypothetical protein
MVDRTTSSLSIKRSGQDSNLRIPYEITDLANPRFRPLSHRSIHCVYPKRYSQIESPGNPVVTILDNLSAPARQIYHTATQTALIVENCFDVTYDFRQADVHLENHESTSYSLPRIKRSYHDAIDAFR